MAKQQSSKSSKLTGLALGAAVVTAIAGGYFLYGPKGKQNRKKVQGWASKAKKEVLTELGKMKEVSEGSYKDVVDTVTDKYKTMKNVGAAEVVALNRELKQHWKDITREAKKGVGELGKKVTKKASKKSVKKSTKKAAPKKAAKKTGKKSVKKSTKKSAKK